MKITKEELLASIRLNIEGSKILETIFFCLDEYSYDNILTYEEIGNEIIETVKDMVECVIKEREDNEND